MIKDFEYQRRIEQNGAVIVLDLAGGVFVTNIKDFRAALKEPLTSDAANVILNCSGLDFLGSSAIGALVEFNEKYKAAGKTLWIVCLSREVKNILNKLSIDTLLNIRDSERVAFERIESK